MDEFMSGCGTVIAVLSIITILAFFLYLVGVL